MSGYRKKVTDETILDEFPGLTARELAAANDLYDHYLFYQKDGHGRRVWTSCCHRANEYIGPDMYLVTPEHRAVLGARHGDDLECPFCGKWVEAKNIGTARSCTALRRYIPVVFISAAEDGETICIQAYWSMKDFCGNYAAEPLYMPTRVYRLRRGEALQWERSDSWENDNWTMRPKESRFAIQPFVLNNDNQGYHIIGGDCLERTFLRYTQYGEWDLRTLSDSGVHTSLVRFLALAAQYPESVEMLMKADLREPLEDYIFYRRKNAAVLRWGEKDPRRAFGLDGGELRDFLGTSRYLETLYVYRAFRRAGVRVCMKDADAVADSLYGWGCRGRARNIAAICAAAKVRPDKLGRYLEQYTGGCHAGGYRSLREIIGHWLDYIEAAKRLGYDMTVPGVLMPRDLQEAHDNAAALVRRQEEEKRAKGRAEKDAEAREKLRLAQAAFEKRLAKLRKQYEFRAGKYFIRVAESAEEIIAEGKALQHCVAGYADRHLSGAVTIIFLRRASAPDTPLVTIEMQGQRMVQAHGFKNEREACPANPKMKRPEELYRAILDPWLAWMKAGSKRDRQGRPVLSEKKDTRVA